MGFSRHLTASEIFEQAATYAVMLRHQNERLSNVVFMGMGEPFHNYANVMLATRRITDELGIAIPSSSVIRRVASMTLA